MSVTTEFVRLLYQVQGQQAIASVRQQLQGVSQAAQQVRADFQAGLITQAEMQQQLRDLARQSSQLRDAMRGLGTQSANWVGQMARMGPAMMSASNGIQDFISNQGNLGAKINGVSNNVGLLIMQLTNFSPQGQIAAAGVQILTAALGAAATSLHINSWQDFVNLFENKWPIPEAADDTRRLAQELKQAKKAMEEFEERGRLTTEQLKEYAAVRKQVADLEEQDAANRARQRMADQLRQFRPNDPAEDARAKLVKEAIANGPTYDNLVKSIEDAQLEQLKKAREELANRAIAMDPDDPNRLKLNFQAMEITSKINDPQKRRAEAQDLANQSGQGMIAAIENLRTLMQKEMKFFEEDFIASIDKAAAAQAPAKAAAGGGAGGGGGGGGGAGQKPMDEAVKQFRAEQKRNKELILDLNKQGAEGQDDLIKEMTSEAHQGILEIFGKPLEDLVISGRQMGNDVRQEIAELRAKVEAEASKLYPQLAQMFPKAFQGMIDGVVRKVRESVDIASQQLQALNGITKREALERLALDHARAMEGQDEQTAAQLLGRAAGQQHAIMGRLNPGMPQLTAEQEHAMGQQMQARLKEMGVVPQDQLLIASSMGHPEGQQFIEEAMQHLGGMGFDEASAMRMMAPILSLRMRGVGGPQAVNRVLNAQMRGQRNAFNLEVQRAALSPRQQGLIQDKADRQRERAMAGFQSVPPTAVKALDAHEQTQQVVAQNQQMLGQVAGKIQRVEAVNRHLLQNNRRLERMIAAPGPTNLDMGR